MKLTKKIFNQATKIEFDTTIYISRDKGSYTIIGGRTKRKNNVSVLYTIPNNNNKKIPNIKGIQREEMEKLWEFLKKNKEITTKDFQRLCPELYKEGGCCVAAFYGIIDTLFPDTFTKKHGKILITKTK